MTECGMDINRNHDQWHWMADWGIGECVGAKRSTCRTMANVPIKVIDKQRQSPSNLLSFSSHFQHVETKEDSQPPSTPGPFICLDVWFDDEAVVLQAENGEHPLSGDMNERCPLVVLHDPATELRLFRLATHDAGLSILLSFGYKEVDSDNFVALQFAQELDIRSVLPATHYGCCRYGTAHFLPSETRLRGQDQIHPGQENLNKRAKGFCRSSAAAACKSNPAAVCGSQIMRHMLN
ncbi:hypothetical protein DFH06DRAFT_1418356 [Mycena polygramma]|nr:hypothetical protein DFH06DRAFT_1418356 [Mycena polygramma]